MTVKSQIVKFTAEFTFEGHAENDAEFKAIATDIISEPRAQAVGRANGYLRFVKASKVKRV